MVRKKLIVEVLRMIEKRDGIITPTALVEEARPASSPIHEAFEWDDTRAAHAHRLSEARQHIQTVRVTLMGREMDGFHNVTVQINKMPTRGYVSAEKVMSKQDLQKQVISAAVREIQYWQTKYKEVSELEGVVNKKKLDRIASSI